MACVVAQKMVCTTAAVKYSLDGSWKYVQGGLEKNLKCKNMQICFTKKSANSCF